MGDDQKALKKRLKVLMTRPENQVCSDCPERKPTWASLVVPPPGSPPGMTQIGAFCCLECSGSHRRLGVHISFVRSVNLDSWKEKEVLAMENGGNARVNAIFEYNLGRSGVQKPSNYADGPTRERFIRDKYERRKFYDPVAFNSLPAPQDTTPQSQQQQQVGPPSDAARQRMEQRRLRKMPSDEERGRAPEPPAGRSAPQTGAIRSRSTDGNRARSRTPPRLNNKPGVQPPPRRGARRTASTEKLPPAPAKEMDLLDLNFDEAAAPTAAPPSNAQQHDLFSFLVADKIPSQEDESAQQQPSAPREQQQPKTSSLDILSLYNTPSSNNNNSQFQGSFSSFANASVSNIMNDNSSTGSYGNNTQSMGGMQSNQGLGGTHPNQMGGMHQGQMAGMNNMMGQMTMGPNSPNQYQQQQMMMMMKQQQMMMQQQQRNMMGIPGGGNQQMMGNNNNMMMMQQQQPQQSQLGGYGAPMGSGPPVSSFQQGQKSANVAKKDDPFAQFGVNHFR